MRLLLFGFTALFSIIRCAVSDLKASIDLAAASIMAVDARNPSPEAVSRMRNYLECIPVDTPASALDPIMKALNSLCFFSELAFFEELFDIPIVIKLAFGNPKWLAYFTSGPKLVLKMARWGCPIPFECVQYSLSSDIYHYKITWLSADWIISERTKALVLLCPPIDEEQEESLFQSIPKSCFGMPQALQVALNQKRNVTAALEGSREALSLNVNREDCLLSALPKELVDAISINMSILAFDRLIQLLSNDQNRF